MTSNLLFQFDTVGEMYTCGQAPITWVYRAAGTTTGFVGLTINISNAVESQQSAPPSTSTSIQSSSVAPIVPSGISSVPSASGSAIITGQTPLPARRRVRRQYDGYGGSWLPNVQQTLVTGFDPRFENYTWQSVNVTQGWYYLSATLDNQGTYLSQNFFVQNGTITSCLFPSPSSSSSAPASTSTSSTTPSASSGAGGLGSNRSSSHTGAIVGGVIGGLAFIVALAAAIIFFLLHRRSIIARARRAQAFIGAPQPKRRHTDSMQVLARGGSGRSAGDTTTPGHSDDALDVGTEKLTPLDGPGFSPYSAPPSEPAFTPAPRRSKRASFGTSSESYGMRTRAFSHSQDGVGAGMEGMTLAQQRRASVDAYRAGLNIATTTAAAAATTSQPAPAPVHTANNMERTPTDRSHQKRKPVPKYDSSDFGDEGSAGHGTGSGSNHGHGGQQTLQHQSSYGSMRAMHVLMPDMPPPAKQ